MDTNLCVSSYIKNIKDELYAFAYKNKKLTKVSKEAVAYCKDVSNVNYYTLRNNLISKTEFH